MLLSMQLQVLSASTSELDGFVGYHLLKYHTSLLPVNENTQKQLESSLADEIQGQLLPVAQQWKQNYAGHEPKMTILANDQSIARDNVAATASVTMLTLMPLQDNNAATTLPMTMPLPQQADANNNAATTLLMMMPLPQQADANNNAATTLRTSKK
jgi:hypothetical protein